MPKLHLVKGTTSKRAHVFVPDAASSTGAGLTGLAFNTASLTGYYYREGAGSATSITLATSTLGTFTSGAFKEISSANMPGAYEIGIPDAALASGADSVIVMYKGAANMVPVVLEIQLTDFNLHTATVTPAANSITSSVIATDAIGASQIASNAITAAKIAADAITAAKVADGTIDAATFASGAINAAAIASDAITAAKIADGAIDAATFAAGAITATVIADGAIDAATFAAGAIDAAAIAADAIGSSELAASAVTEIQAAIAAGAVASVTGSVGSVASGGITAASFAAGAIDAAAIATDAIGSAELAASAVTEIQAAIAAGAVASVTGAVGSVTGAVGSVASGGITAASFAAGAIDAAAIATDAIGSAELAASAVTEIQSGLATAAALATVQADTDDIQTRLPAALVGGRMDANVGALSGDATAADNAESFFDGTGYAGTNNVIPTVTSVTAIATDGISASSIQADAIGASELNATAATEIAAAVWDRARASHLADGSFGQSLQIIRGGTAQAGAGSAITLDAGASATDDFYNNGLIEIISGTGAPQARYITDYVGATKVATVSAWVTAPDNTSVFVIQPGDAIPGATAPTAAQNAAAVWDEARSSHTTSGTFGQGVASVQGAVTGAVGSVTGAVGSVTGAVGSVTGNVGGSVGSVATGGITAASLAPDAGVEIAGAVWDEARSAHTTAGSFGRATQIIRDGTAQGATSTTITLDASASAINDFYNDTLIAIIAGTGVGQSRFVSDYVGTSKVATVSAVWSTTPDATSVFAIETFGAIPGATAPTAAQVADAVWDELRADHTTAATFGQGVSSVQGAVTGAVGSVTGAVGSVTGSVGSVTGNVGGSVASLGAQAKLDVNAEMVDVLTVDTIAELSQGQPATLPTFASAVMTTYMAFRNQSTQNTSGVNEYTNNAGVVVFKRACTDDGTTLTRPKLASGP